MRNLKRFEEEVYKAVTSELNLLTKGAEGVRELQTILDEVLKALHNVTHEVVLQLACGMVMWLRGENKK